MVAIRQRGERDGPLAGKRLRTVRAMSHPMVRRGRRNRVWIDVDQDREPLQVGVAVSLPGWDAERRQNRP
jgi:hypothetical protein